MENLPTKEPDNKRVYLQYPLRKSRFDPKFMKIFYIFLGFLWIGSGIFFYVSNPDSNIMVPVVYGAIGIIIFVLANYYEAIFSGKYIDYSTNGMMVKLGFNKPVFLKWQQINEVRLEKQQFSIIRKDGQRHDWKLNRSAMYNWSGFIKSLKENLAAKDVSYSL